MLEVLRGMRQTVSNTKWFAYAYFMLQPSETVLHSIMMLACLQYTQDVDTVTEVFARLYNIDEATTNAMIARSSDPQFRSLDLIDHAIGKVAN